MEVENLIDLYKNESVRFFDRADLQKKITDFIMLIFEAYENEKSIFIAGNGGTVSYIQNMVADFNLHVFVSEDKTSQTVERNKFKCVNLCSDSAIITGVANDLGFEFIYSEQLKYLGERGDIFLGLSGSGNSKNILEAMKLARKKGMTTVLITRNRDNKCVILSDLDICVEGISFFPGQTGKNVGNFHYEDILSKITHIAVGALKKKVQGLPDYTEVKNEN